MTQGSRHLDRARPKTPGVVNSALALTVLLLVSAIALTARQPPPPAIAEFAPTAVEQITDAPAEQSSEFGDGDGGAGGAGTTATTEPDAIAAGKEMAVIDVARVRRCIGDPPRQIEDPQSPPCVPYWEGSNGGATWKGVTGDTITIAYANINDELMRAYENFFNARFEFYGRKLKLVRYQAPDDKATPASVMQSEAVNVDSTIAPFAVATYTNRGGQEAVFYDELARRKILSVNNRPTAVDESHLREWHPYQWSYIASYDAIARGKARYACRALKGRPASFAGGLQRDQPRVFGLVYSQKSDGFQPDISHVVNELRRCDIELAAVAAIPNSDSEAAVLRMQQEGVTTVFCECHEFPGVSAASHGYAPEWIIGSYAYHDWDINGRLIDAPPGALNTAVALTWWNKQSGEADAAWAWAAKEGDPSFDFNNNADFTYYDGRWGYHSMMVLASGIQMAGPNLTPETFARGLQSATFPNPGFDGPPYYQSFISFKGKHSAQTSAGVMWWDGNAESNWGGRGTWCDMYNGARFGISAPMKEFPTDTRGFRQGPCV